MHISRVQLVNYRNFARAEAVFNKGVNTIIGENGSGKTNLFRAMRLLLDDDLMRFAYRLEAGDFHRDLGNWRGHWIIISLEFSEVSQDEAIQALFLHGTGVIEDGAVTRATYNLIFRPSASIRQKLTDLDACFFDTAPNPDDPAPLAKLKAKAAGSAEVGVVRQARLNAFKADNPWLSTHFAPCTFEVEFIRAGNAEAAVESLTSVYTAAATIQTATEDLRSNDPERFGKRILTMAENAGKGWLAIQLAKRVDTKTRIPPYLLEAIFTAHRPLSGAVLKNMIDYRLKAHPDPGILPAALAQSVRDHAARFQRGEIETQVLLDVLVQALPGDVIIAVLGHA